MPTLSILSSLFFAIVFYSYKLDSIISVQRLLMPFDFMRYYGD
jgi:hypothetical protein